MPIVSDAGKYFNADDPKLTRAVQKLLPGPVTLVIEVDDDVIEANLDEVPLRFHLLYIYER